MTRPQLDEERIFHVARTMEDPQVRSEYLDQVCAGDQALRERVEALLAVHETEQGFLRSSSEFATTAEQTTIAEGPGQRIGRYKLLQKIGEGGFGIVFMAEQKEPVRRRIALKVIKPGMDSSQIIARFEAERQALAMMDHPNIARVLDAGATDSGRPFFVMELVKGVPITEFCDENELATCDRLRLFIAVCQAIQHAHQKGVIHRDLKPSNIMVTLNDGLPMPKVIDFGIAKAINRDLTDKTLFTAYGQMVGTPQYMSPEQAETNAMDVDTRSDIYSLGVLLYELLTGTTPLDAKRLRTAGYGEMQRIIREEEPQKPSTRLSTMGDRLTAIARHRGANPRELTQYIRGDLDWIVMKTLDKDRSRRYDTAIGLADDVQRYLSNEQIAARAPTAGYRLRKLYQRNRSAVIGISLLLITFLLGFAGTLCGLLRSNVLAEQRQDLVLELRSDRSILRRQRYMSDMPLALDSIMHGDTNRAQQLLKRNVPAPGQADLRGIEWDYLNNLLQRERSVPHMAFLKRVQNLCASPSQGLFATCDRSGAVTIINSRTHEKLHELRYPAEDHWFSPVAVFSPDGGSIAYRSGRHLLGIRELATQTLKEVATPGAPQSLATSPDGKILAIGYPERVGLELRSWNDGRLLAVLDRRSSTIGLAFSQDGKKLLSISWPEQDIQVWDVTERRQIDELPGQGYTDVAAAKGSPLFATGSDDHVVRLWNSDTLEQAAALVGHKGLITCLCFHPDSDVLVTGASDRTIRVWDLQTLTARTISGAHSTSVADVAFIDDDNTLVSCGDSDIRFWRGESFTSFTTPKRPRQTSEPAFTEDDRNLVYYKLDGKELRQLDTATFEDELLFEANDGIWSLAVSSSGKIATGSFNGVIELWNRQKRSSLTLEPGLNSQVVGLRFSSAGNYLASASKGGVYVWGLGRDSTRHRVSNRHSLTVAFSPDDSLLASGRMDGRLEIWAWPSAEIVAEIPAHDEPVLHVAFSRSRNALVTCGMDGDAKVWDPMARTLLGHFEGAPALWCAEFCPDGKTIVTTGEDGYVKVWDLTTGEQRFRFPRLDGAGNCLTFSRSGHRLAVCTFEGQIQIWDVGPSSSRDADARSTSLDSNSSGKR